MEESGVITGGFTACNHSGPPLCEGLASSKKLEFRHEFGQGAEPGRERCHSENDAEQYAPGTGCVHRAGQALPLRDLEAVLSDSFECYSRSNLDD